MYCHVVLTTQDDKDPLMSFSPPVGSDLSNVRLTFDPSSSDLPLSHGRDNVPPDLEVCIDSRVRGMEIALC